MKLLLLAFLFSAAALHADAIVPMYTTGTNQLIGTVTLHDSQYGMLITPKLINLPPGVHGFHVHQNGSCADDGMAAGGHFDPAHTNKHLGPYNDDGHLGDLPVLVVDSNGSATLPLLAPRLKVADIEGHTLMIHEGGDNYSDDPPMGGGGKRVACGIIP